MDLDVGRLKSAVTSYESAPKAVVEAKAKKVGEAIRAMGFDDRVAKNHHIVAKYIARLILDSAPKGLLICGDTGTGKTLAMSLINEQLKRRRRQAGAITAQFFANEVSAHGAHVAVASFTSELKAEKWIDGRWDLSSYVPVDLIVDDLGAETEAMHYGVRTESLVELIAARYDHWMATRARTHFTTNLSMARIEERYGKRISSRLTEMCYVVRFDGEDRRTERTK
jgi:DNA replication protein DnaC